MLVVGLVIAVAASLPHHVASAKASPITEIPLPASFESVSSITPGPDGSVWLTNGGHRIIEVTPSGKVITVQTDDRSGSPRDLVLGPDGNFWFTDLFQSVGKLSPNGQITQFPTPTPRSGARGIVPGRDGNLWFSEPRADRIARITPEGSITEFYVGSGTAPTALVAGADGNVWFLGEPALVGRLTPTGEVTTFAIPKPHGSARGLIAAPDGSLWFGDYGRGTLRRVGPEGTMTEIAIPGRGSALSPNPFFGPDGRVWFIVGGPYRLGAVTLDGILTMYPVGPGHQFSAAVASPDGNVWITEYRTKRIDRVTSDGAMRQWRAPSGLHPTSYLTVGSDGQVWFLMTRDIVRGGYIVGEQNSLGLINSTKSG